MTTEIQTRIDEIIKEIRETPYHKGTEHHIGLLKARLSKLKDEQYIKQVKAKGGGGEGFAIRHSGDASVTLVGFPSVGKSTLLNCLTNANSRVAAYDFTTLSVIPGMLFHQGAYIQIFDIPGLLSGAATGRGRGKEVIAVARNVDLIICIIDATKPQQLSQIESELYQAGVRINQTPPQITIRKKSSSGIIIHSNIKQEVDSDTITSIASEMGVRNGEITLKQKITLDQLIDTLSGNRTYPPAIYVINKSDKITSHQFNQLKHAFSHALFISAQNREGLTELINQIWKSLKLIRIHLKRPDQKLAEEKPLIMRRGQTIKDVIEKISLTLPEDQKTARIEGPGASFPGQKVPFSTLLQDNMQITF